VSEEEPPDLVPLLRQLLAAGGPSEWPANVPWPLHQAVTEHHRVLCPNVTPLPAAGTGWQIPGLEFAVTELARSGRLRPREEGIARWWVVNDHESMVDRRELLRCDPVVAQDIYLAARRWAALTAMSAKTVRSASASLASISRSGMPNRRQPLTPVR
jgi:hypothetical protein